MIKAIFDPSRVILKGLISSELDHIKTFNYRVNERFIQTDVVHEKREWYQARGFDYVVEDEIKKSITDKFSHNTDSCKFYNFFYKRSVIFIYIQQLTIFFLHNRIDRKKGAKASDFCMGMIT